MPRSLAISNPNPLAAWNRSESNLIFFSLLFMKKARKIPKQQGLLILAEPLKSLGKKGESFITARISWRVPNPPGANPLVAERAFPTSDYWGRTGVARCAEEMTGICRDFQYAAAPLAHETAKTSKGPFQLPGGG